MAVTNTPNQMYFRGSGYLDKKHGAIYPDLESLNKIPFLQKFQGLTVIVTDDGSGDGPCEYWIPGTDRKFVKKGSKVSLTAGEGIDIQDGTISVETTWVDQKIENKTSSLYSKIESIAQQANTNKTNIDYLNDQISKISGGKPETDNKTIEYIQVPVPDAQPKEVLSVKVAPSTKKEPNFLTKKDEGLFSTIPVDGDDWGTEVGA